MFKTCFDRNYGVYILTFVLSLSFAINLFFMIFLSCQNMLKSKKYSHLFYISFMNIVLILGFTFYALYTLFSERIQLYSLCIVKLQALSISFQMYFLAMVCLGIDCTIAVISPIKYRSMSSLKLFVKINLSVFVILLVTQITIPLWHVFTVNPDKREHCESNVFRVLQIYFFGNIITSGLLLIAEAVVNIMIAVAVIYSLNQRKNLMAKEKEFGSKALKLVLRTTVLVGGNYGCLSPLFLYPFGYLERTTPPTVLLSISLSVGLWNSLIFMFFDQQFRTNFNESVKSVRKSTARR